MSTPKYKVCVKCKTYNQEGLIRQAIDGFLTQKTNFPFIAVILDDASTDDTPKIIKEYEEKDPEILKGIYLKDNLWQKGISQDYLWKDFEDQSEYITYCDGDDYWIDNNKLQREVDILDSHPEYSMVCESRYVLCPNGDKYEDIFPKTVFKTNDFLRGLYLHSQVMMHRSIPNYLQDMFKQYNLDYKKMGGRDEMMLGYYYSLRGDVLALPNIVAVYRMDGNGVWSKFSEAEKAYHELIAFHQNHKYLQFQYREIFAETFFNKAWSNIWYPIKHKKAEKVTIKIFFLLIRYLTFKEFFHYLNKWLSSKTKKRKS